MKYFPATSHFQKLTLLITVVFLSHITQAETATYLLGADAQTERLLVDMEWLNHHKNDSNLVILDVRTEKQYLEGHIPNAINLPVDKTFSQKKPKNLVAPVSTIQDLFSNAGIDHTQNVVIYDQGSFLDAGRIFWILEAHGHRRSALLGSGFNAWEMNQLPISFNSKTPEARTFIPSIQPERIATKLHTLLAIEDKNKIIIDARAPEEFLGLKSSTKRFGHIPNAINIPIEQNFKHMDRIENLHNIGELKRMFKDVNKDKKIIAYCNRGKQSSLTYFILRQLGIDAAHYDGSWLEWGNDLDLPIANSR